MTSHLYYKKYGSELKVVQMVALSKVLGNIDVLERHNKGTARWEYEIVVLEGELTSERAQGIRDMGLVPLVS